MPHITMDPSIRVRSAWPTGNVVGKKLTNRKISQYQKEGKYGPPTRIERVKRRLAASKAARGPTVADLVRKLTGT